MTARKPLVQINGQLSELPNGDIIIGGGSGIVSSDREKSTGASDTAVLGDGNIAVLWNSSTLTAKSQTIPASTGSLQTILIMDFKGDSDDYPIEITPVSGNINRVLESVFISTPFNSITLIDTSAGWIMQ